MYNTAIDFVIFLQLLQVWPGSLEEHAVPIRASNTQTDAKSIQQIGSFNTSSKLGKNYRIPRDLDLQ